jgi:superfamily II DNA/RNA helicase
VNREPKHQSRSYDKPETPYVPVDDVVLERLEAQSILADEASGASFADLGLGKNIISALAELGAASPFPIQVATIPDVLAGRDVLGRGRTGSGKTIAFGAPLVERLLVANAGKKRTQGRAPRAIVLAPTRELAMQINRTIMPIAKSVGLFTMTIVGGMPQGPQVMALRRGVDIVIATPGRLEDLQRQGHLPLDEVSVVVLDEADHMCDLGFLEPVQRILRSLQGDVQHLLFSATLDKGVAAIIDEFLEEPSVHEVAGEDQASSTIDHRVFLIDHHDKIPILTHILRGDVKAIVFARTRAFTDQLADELDDAGIDAIAIHGDLTQAKRARALERFANNRARVLVATDVAARGIHVDDVDLVVQADAPDEYKTYLHRSGRTGRAGRSGTVVTLVPHRRARRMKEMLDRAEIDALTVPVKQGDRHLDNLV